METRTLPLICIALAISFLAGALPMIGMGGADTEWIPPSRAAGADLIVENGTVTLTKNEEFKSIKIRDGGHLVITGVRIEAEDIVCRGDQVNTSLTIQGGLEPAYFRVSRGVFNVKAEYVRIERAVITVDNINNTIGKDIHASMVLISLKNELSLNGSTITVSGKGGAAGDKENYGANGGNAQISIQSVGKRLSITKTEVKALGGKGGDNFNIGMRGGDGGEAFMRLKGDSVYVDNCPYGSQAAGLLAQGGDLGSSGMAGNKNGYSKLSFEATNDIVISRSEIESVPGTSVRQGDQSRLEAKSQKGSFLVDHQKAGDERFQTLSRYYAMTITIDAAVSAELHEVDVGDTVPDSYGAPVRSFWWAFVWVRDVYGEPLKGAGISWYMGTDIVPYPRDGSKLLTDAQGKASVEVEGRINEDKIKYRFEAEIMGQIKMKSEETIFENAQTRQGSNRYVNINITRIDLQIATINSEPFKNDMTVGGVIVFEGRCESLASGGKVLNVSLYEGPRFLGAATSTALASAPVYSSWSLTLDTERQTQNKHYLTMSARDTLYTVNMTFSIIFDSQAVNHRPQLVSLQVKHALGTSDPAVREEIQVHFTNNDPLIEIFGLGWDRDYSSTKLTMGKEIDYALVTIKDSQGVLYFDKPLSGKDDFTKKNETGGYMFNFQVDLSKSKGSLDQYPQGIYTLTVVLRDNAGFESLNSWVHLNITVDNYPKVELFIEGADPPTMNDIIYIEPTWDKLRTDKSDTLTVTFNVTKCEDADSTLPIAESWKELKIEVTVRPDGGEAEVAYDGKGQPSFEYTFDVKDIKKGDQGVFTINVVAEDVQGLKTTKVYKARVVHDPPVLPNSLIGQLAGVEDFGFDLGGGLIAYAAMIVVGIAAYLGLFSFNFAKVRREKARKIDIIEKMKSEEKKQQKSVVEDEVRSGAGKPAPKQATAPAPQQVKPAAAPAQQTAAPAARPSAPSPVAPSVAPSKPPAAPAQPSAAPPTRPPMVPPQAPKVPPTPPPPMPGPPAPPKTN